MKCANPSVDEEAINFDCPFCGTVAEMDEPTLVALKEIVPHMPKGAVIVFDEFNYQNFRGETKALKDFAPLGGFEIKKFPYDSCLAYARLL